MKSVKVSGGFLLRFDLYDDFMNELKHFVREQAIHGAWLNGLGAAKSVELGYYNLKSKTYEWHQLTELMEITNLTGNVSWQENEPAIHVHVTFSDQNLQAIGGHVKDLIVGGTCEVYLQILDTKLTRQRDQQTGLNLLDL